MLKIASLAKAFMAVVTIEQWADRVQGWILFRIDEVCINISLNPGGWLGKDCQGRRLAAIDPDGAGVEAARHLVHNVDVLGPDAGGQTKLALVGALDHLQRASNTKCLRAGRVLASRTASMREGAASSLVGSARDGTAPSDRVTQPPRCCHIHTGYLMTQK